MRKRKFWILCYCWKCFWIIIDYWQTNQIDFIQSITFLYIADMCVCVCVCVCVANNHNQEEGCNIMVPNSFFFSFVIAKLLLHITIHVLLITTALIVVCWDLTGKVGNNFLQRQWQRRLQLRINLPSNNQSRYILKSVHVPACLLVLYYHQEVKPVSLILNNSEH